jgi:hypothetical protein
VQQQIREKTLCTILEEVTCTDEERRIVMSSIMKPPAAEPSAPPIPDYAPFPGYTQQPRKSYRWVWMTVGIVALVSILGCALLALGAGWAVTTYYNSSLRASDMYYSAIKTQDYATAYTYLGSRLQTVYSQQTFTQAAQQQDEALGRVSRFGMVNIPTGDPANVTLTVTRANGTAYDVHLELRQEGGAWKITAFDRI